MRWFDQVSVIVFSVGAAIQATSLLLSIFSKKFRDQTADIMTQSILIAIVSLTAATILLFGPEGQHRFIVTIMEGLSWWIIVRVAIITGISLVVGKPQPEQPQKPMGVDEGKDFIEPVGSHVDKYI